MALVIGSRMLSLMDVLNDSGPVHTLQEAITPEMVVAVQNQYEEEIRAREVSHSGGIHIQARRHSHEEQ